MLRRQRVVALKESEREVVVYLEKRANRIDGNEGTRFDRRNISSRDPSSRQNFQTKRA